MAREMKGTGRVTVFPLQHIWPDTYGIIGYTTTGHFGDTAIVGYIPIPEVPDVYLMDVAARMAGGQARTTHTEWVLCTAWSARSVPKPNTLDFGEAAWALEVDSHSEPSTTKYGHSSLYVGRFRLDEPELMEQARKLIKAVPA